MSSSLRTAVEDLRAALVDEDAGNGHVRDCAFEVVETWDAEVERTPTLETTRRLTRLLSSLDENMAHTCRHTNVLRDAGVVVGFKSSLLELASQVQRFVAAADVAEYRRRLHADEIHLQDYGMPDGVGMCGAGGVVTMSHHEIKRGRITCPACLMAHHDHAC